MSEFQATLHNQSICFIGGGSMSEAIIRGLLAGKKLSPEQIAIMNRANDERLAELHETYGVRTCRGGDAKADAIRSADIILLAMKPKDAADALKNIRHLIRERQLIISVVAGLSIATIHKLIDCNVPVVRTMPNTSSTIGLGATGVSFSSQVSVDQKRLALDMICSIGIACPVEERLLDIVTGVSGSGPAYVYYFMEAMIAAGIDGGLSEDVSRQLTLQTILGAVQMVNNTMEDPALLRRKVTSPGGTTQAAIETLDRYAFPEAIKRAIHRASERAGEMGAIIDAEAE